MCFVKLTFRTYKTMQDWTPVSPLRIWLCALKWASCLTSFLCSPRYNQCLIRCIIGFNFQTTKSVIRHVKQNLCDELQVKNRDASVKSTPQKSNENEGNEVLLYFNLRIVIAIIKIVNNSKYFQEMKNCSFEQRTNRSYPHFLKFKWL